MENNIYDSHFHCQSGAVEIVKNTFETVGIRGGLLLPWENDDENVLNEIEKKSIKDIDVALVPRLSLLGSQEWAAEMKRIEDTSKYYSAIKIYKQYINETQYNLLANEDFWELLFDLKMKVVVHFGDPYEFWMHDGGKRNIQYENHKEFQYFKNKQIRSREEALTIKNELLKRYETIGFICAHLGGFPRNIDELSEFTGQNYSDTSASLDDVLLLKRDVVKKIFEENGDRILFGSDTMFNVTQNGKDLFYTKIMANYLRMNINQLVSEEMVNTSNPMELKWKVNGLGLGEKVKEKIFETNYIKLFRV